MNEPTSQQPNDRPEPSINGDGARGERSRGGQPGWFLFGALVGAVAMAGAMTLLSADRAPALDLAAVRQAAREGAAEAISGAQPIGPLAPAAPAAAQPQAQQAAAPGAAAIADSIVVRVANVLGKAEAPVTVVEYSDFQCPYCLRHFNETQARLISDYVNTGKVKILFKNFPIPELHPQAIQAAVAAECAADQGKFWVYHDTLFQRFGAKTIDYSLAGLTSYAVGFQLDRDKFDACLKDEKITARINADRQEGNRLGVRGTPTFFINGQQLVGAQPFEAFKAAIDAALAGRN
ncbi:MAG: DsbA family protein [Thermoflexales bacterium]